MKAEDFIAGAVTMPLKLPVLAKMDRINDLSRVVGAVNTITVTTDKKLVVSNTESARTVCSASTGLLIYYTALQASVMLWKSCPRRVGMFLGWSSGLEGLRALLYTHCWAIWTVQQCIW